MNRAVTPMLHSKTAKYFQVLACLLFGIFLVACGKTPNHVKYIPENTSFVVSLNLKNLTEKAGNWKDLLDSDAIAALDLLKLEEYKDFGKAFTTSGINFKEATYIFGHFTQQHDSSYVVMSFQISNESSFDKFLRNLPNKQIKIRTYAGMHYTLLDNKSILGWVNQVGILIVKPKKTSEKELKNQLFKIRDLPEKQALINTNTEFKKLQAKPHDIATWVSLEAFQREIRHFIRRYPIPIDLDLDQNFLTVITQFQEGKAEIDLEFHNLNESLKDYKDVVKSGIDQELIKNIPIQSPMAIFGLGLNMEGIKNAINSLGFDRLFNSLVGLNIEDLTAVMSGDILAVIKTLPQNEDSNNPQYELILGVGISNAAKLGELLTRFTEEESLLEKEDAYYEPKTETYLLPREQLLFITTSDTLRQTLNFNEPNKVGKGLSAMGDKSCFMLYTDLRNESRRQLPSALFGEDKLIEGLAKYSQMPIESFSLSTIPLKNNISYTKMVLSFSQKQKNALRLLVEMLKQQERKFLPKQPS